MKILNFKFDFVLVGALLYLKISSIGDARFFIKISSKKASLLSF
jgi:hypothetical protein